MKVIKTTHNGYIVLHNDIERTITYIAGTYYWDNSSALSEDKEYVLRRAIEYWLINND